MDSDIGNEAKISQGSWLNDHGDALYAYAMIRVKISEIAEDLVQETLLSAFKSIDKFKGESSERTWLTGILKHKVLDHFRKSGREQPLDERSLEGSIDHEEWFDETNHWKINPNEWAQPERSLEQEQFWNTLNSCVDKLPNNLRVLYILREFDGIESNELIETLKISSRNNLWVMLSRARMQLRLCLESNWFND